MLEIIVLLIFIALIVCNKLIIKQVGPTLLIPGVCFEDEDDDDEDDEDDDDEEDDGPVVNNLIATGK
jgi:hypothetical protein